MAFGYCQRPGLGGTVWLRPSDADDQVTRAHSPRQCHDLRPCEAGVGSPWPHLAGDVHPTHAYCPSSRAWDQPPRPALPSPGLPAAPAGASSLGPLGALASKAATLPLGRLGGLWPRLQRGGLTTQTSGRPPSPRDSGQATVGTPLGWGSGSTVSSVAGSAMRSGTPGLWLCPLRGLAGHRAAHLPGTALSPQEHGGPVCAERCRDNTRLRGRCCSLHLRSSG